MAADLRHDRNANEPGYTAGLILAAARKAHGLDAEEPSGLAAEVLRAGAIARGEVAAEVTVENSTARAVILSGRRARGETLSADDQAFLTAYLEKMRR